MREDVKTLRGMMIYQGRTLDLCVWLDWERDTAASHAIDHLISLRLVLEPCRLPARRSP